MLITAWTRTLAAMMLALAGPATQLRAQTAAAPGTGPGSVSGLVVDAATGERLIGVTVTLGPSPGGLLVSSGRGALLLAARAVETDAAGSYRFDDVAPGRYRLRVERIGYRATSIEVEVRRPIAARVSVGMELEPVPLEPVHVQEQALPPFRRVAGGPSEPDAARMLLERERQATFLTSDSRALTYADLIDGVTLGETDVFRALQRFPGVATRDDYTAELWTRGAPWSQTRVTFDGLPLFNPVHAVGVFSAVMPDILGAVFFHPGHRSVSSGEGAAGLVDLRSRAGGGDGELRGAVDVSMASAKLELDQRIGDRTAWIVSARRSYLDVLTGGMDWLGLDQLELPYAFHDVSGRFDQQLGERSALEVSGLWEDDRLFGDVEGILEGTNANWGNAVARATLHSPLGPLAARHSIGVSRYRSTVQESGDSTTDGRPIPWVEPAADNRVLYVRAASELEPWAATGRPPSWTAGWELVLQRTHYDGPEPRFHPVRPDTTMRVFREDELWTAGAWAEARLTAGEKFTILPGVRVEVGSRIIDIESAIDRAARTARPTSKLHLAPRIAARLALTSDLSLSASASRSWQYLQAIALAGPSAHPAFHASQFWLLAGEAAPAIRADLVSIGAEQWLGAGWLLSANAYRRRSTGLAVPDPRPGNLEGRPLFVAGRNDAGGIEAGLRRVAGRWTASFGWTLGESEIEAAGWRYAAPADRRYRVDATAAARLASGLRVGLAYTAMSGAPYTRVKSRIRTDDCELFGFGCNQSTAAIIEEPNARRSPAYRSMDAIVMLTRTISGVEASAYVQIRNLLGRDNAVTYSGSIYDVNSRPRTVDEVIWHDRFESGLPRLPLVGARITF